MADLALQITDSSRSSFSSIEGISWRSGKPIIGAPARLSETPPLLPFNKKLKKKRIIIDFAKVVQAVAVSHSHFHSRHAPDCATGLFAKTLWECR